ncbi:hypothetical protein [Kamptonema formosum]|uniref:hypothetical protein n=1 Tax=Kamptonema formosum TaxID=331992 RepID=UPI000345D2E8|nr:hypothetical protein [Oscillatoria sp. PCC 10802]
MQQKAVTVAGGFGPAGSHRPKSSPPKGQYSFRCGTAGNGAALAITPALPVMPFAPLSVTPEAGKISQSPLQSASGDAQKNRYVK